MIKTQIKDALQKILHDLGITDITPQLDSPADGKFGDYTTNVALIAAKKLGKNPRELAEEIVNALTPELTKLQTEKVEIAGPGFINFWVKKEVLINKLESRIRGNDKVISDVGKGKKVVVEYSSPNIAKPFTIGHLRSTIIGDAVANLLEAIGWEVYRDNHLGDWGTQFGKQIFALKHINVISGELNKELNDEATLRENLEIIEKDERPVKLLVDLYIKFHEVVEKNIAYEDIAREYFRMLEQGDQEMKQLWQKCIDWSWKEFEQIYKQLNVSFTENKGRGYGESFFEDKMQSVIGELKEKGLLKEGKEGAQMVFFSEETKMPPLMILKKDGASLYATRDLTTDKFRLSQYSEDVVVINEVGAEQSLYWEQVFHTEYLLGWYKPGQRVHVKHGMYRFKEGKMSTRKGNVIWLEDVLEEAEKRARQLSKRQIPATEDATSFGVEDIKNEKHSEAAKSHQMSIGEINKTALQVGIGAIKWNDLKRDAKQDITFDWDDILNMEGNSGPYIQYTFARTQSVLRKAGESKLELLTFNAELEKEEEMLLRLVYKFEETVVAAAEKYSPNILANYLFNLAQQFNLFYQKLPILKEAEHKRNFRLALTQSVGKTLEEGLALLGIQAPQTM